MTDPFVAASAAPLLLIVLFGLFFFLIVMPQRRRQRAAQQQARDVQVGNEVLTVGGLIGKVVEADDAELKVEIADGVVVRIARRGVSTVLEPEAEEPEGEEEPEETRGSPADPS